MRALLALAVILLTSPALARPLSTDAPDCGGEAHSSATIVENRPARHGPISAVPQTLCADVAPQQAPTRIDILVSPYLSTGGDGQNGTGSGTAPYRGRPPRY